MNKYSVTKEERARAAGYIRHSLEHSINTACTNGKSRVHVNIISMTGDGISSARAQVYIVSDRGRIINITKSTASACSLRYYENVYGVNYLLVPNCGYRREVYVGECIQEATNMAIEVESL